MAVVVILKNLTRNTTAELVVTGSVTTARPSVCRCLNEAGAPNQYESVMTVATDRHPTGRITLWEVTWI